MTNDILEGAFLFRWLFFYMLDILGISFAGNYSSISHSHILTFLRHFQSGAAKRETATPLPGLQLLMQEMALDNIQHEFVNFLKNNYFFYTIVKFTTHL